MPVVLLEWWQAFIIPDEPIEPRRPMFFLASGSPRRRRILQFLDLPFRVVTPIRVLERRKPGESASVLVRRLALEKALSVSRKFPAHWVIGADTVVVHQN